MRIMTDQILPLLTLHVQAGGWSKFCKKSGYWLDDTGDARDKPRNGQGTRCSQQRSVAMQVLQINGQSLSRRLKTGYGLSTALESHPQHTACWLTESRTTSRWLVGTRPRATTTFNRCGLAVINLARDVRQMHLQVGPLPIRFRGKWVRLGLQGPRSKEQVQTIKPAAVASPSRNEGMRIHTMPQLGCNGCLISSLPCDYRGPSPRRKTRFLPVCFPSFFTRARVVDACRVKKFPRQ